MLVRLYSTGYAASASCCKGDLCEAAPVYHALSLVRAFLTVFEAHYILRPGHT